MYVIITDYQEEDDVDEGGDDKKNEGSGDKPKTSPKKSAEAKKPSKSDLDAEEVSCVVEQIFFYNMHGRNVSVL